MLDWMLSKVGLMIFIAALVGIVFSFSAFQLNFLEQGGAVQTANTISKIIDSMCNNCTIEYLMTRNYTITVKGSNVTVNSVFRSFLSTASPVNIKSSAIKIYKEEDVVHVKEI